MEPEKIKKLEALLQNGKREEAEKLLQETLAGELSEADRAALNLNFAEISMKASNQVNGAYLESLQETIELLKTVKLGESKINEEIKLVEVREGLAG